MECARRDKEDIVGFDRAVFSRHGRTFNDWQYIALYALARHVRACAHVLSGDFIDFVEEYDAILLGTAHRLARDLVHIDELFGFFLNKQPPCFGDAHLFLLFLFRQYPAEHVVHVDIYAHRDEHVLPAVCALFNFQLDNLVFKQAVAKV
ncbi:hypothetical protein SDC9_143720 [bioreactor metagenome]|uniref:Uncharacterized protein n=1 Tax=bioreactor metagenome TaxID=1076179 RepID=A0A645E4Q3_9ZZZZ